MCPCSTCEDLLLGHPALSRHQNPSDSLKYYEVPYILSMTDIHHSIYFQIIFGLVMTPNKIQILFS